MRAVRFDKFSLPFFGMLYGTTKQVRDTDVCTSEKCKFTFMLIMQHTVHFSQCKNTCGFRLNKN